jgi:hypothetical protein
MIAAMTAGPPVDAPMAMIVGRLAGIVAYCCPVDTVAPVLGT